MFGIEFQFHFRCSFIEFQFQTNFERNINYPKMLLAWQSIKIRTHTFIQNLFRVKQIYFILFILTAPKNGGMVAGGSL